MQMRFFILLACVIVLMHGAAVRAAPDEIEVYTEDINAPGEFGLEQHLNYAINGAKVPDYPGQMISHHVMRITPEFSYGLSKTLEAGLYIPFALTPDGNFFLNAMRLRLKYIAPRQEADTMFYGLNVELSRDSLRTSESLSSLELRPIVGYRDAQWLVSFNPILNTALAANVNHQVQFEPALKVAHRAGEEVWGGVEYYGTYGALSHVLPSSQRGHVVYAVIDTKSHGSDINFGIGRGFNAGDVWVVKAIIELPLN